MPFPVSYTLNSVFRLLFFTSILFAPSLSATNDSMHFPTQKHNCIHHHFSALLGIKYGFRFSNHSSTTLSSWNPNNTNCCSWEGITCNDTTGHVIGLDLSNSHVSGQMDFQILFRIRSLQRLNLAGTSFHPSPIPSGFDQFPALIHLNVSHSSSFSGQIPLGISRLTGLVSLDLSYSDLILDNPNLHVLVQNLSSLRELYLDGVNIGMTGSEWGQALSSPLLPSLQRLSLSRSNLSGPIPSSLSKLHSLSELDLSGNELSSRMPSFVGNLSSLTSLNLSECRLYGEFPQSIFRLPNLQTLDLDSNPDLTGYLPEFPQNSSLQKLLLSTSGFSGQLPESVGNLKLLTRLDLSDNSFNGSIPSSLFSLPSLQSLNLPNNQFCCQLDEFSNVSSSPLELVDLSNNMFHGPIPKSVFELRRLTSLALSGNNFSGAVDFGLLKNLTKLQHIDFSHNSLSGNLLFADNIPSLRTIDLSENHFSGQLLLHNASTSLLKCFHLPLNDFQGPIPRWIFQLPQLSDLDLSKNKFSGAVDLSLLKNLQKLDQLDLSDNRLSIINKGSNSSSISFPQMSYLSLRFCNVSEFPEILRNQEHLKVLDLSKNRINGVIPQWLWNAGSHRTLSHNTLEELEGSLPNPPMLSSLKYLDLSSNELQGPLPSPIFDATSLLVINLSNNNLSGSLNQTFRKGSQLMLLHLSGNRLEGPLPPSLAHCRKLEVLDLGENQINDTFPSWLQNLPELRILVLRSNQFYGNIWHRKSTASILQQLNIFDVSSNSLTGNLPSDAFKKGCQLLLLNLNGNRLQGPLPRSLTNCRHLRALDVGENGINDAFPFWLQNLPELSILVLRSNQFHSSIGGTTTSAATTFQSLKIFDIASNSFTGGLPSNVFKGWKAMIQKINSQFSYQSSSKLKWTDAWRGTIWFDFYCKTPEIEVKYLEALNLTMKKIQLRYERIRHDFAFIDLSSNRFDGYIPESVGDLNLLHSLNMSCNNFTGQIPASIGKLTNLEALDILQNNLIGEIPEQLVDLGFLQVLNVSCNSLVGSIPQGRQFDTFDNNSFLGNPGLCGFQVSRKCGEVKAPPPSSQSDNGYEQSGDDEYDWRIIWIGFGVGYGVGWGILYWTFALWRDGRRRFYLFFDRMFSLIFPSAPCLL